MPCERRGTYTATGRTLAVAAAGKSARRTSSLGIPAAAGESTAATGSRGEALGAGLAGALRASLAGERVSGPVELGVGGSWGTTELWMTEISLRSGAGAGETQGCDAAEVAGASPTRVARKESTRSTFLGAVLTTRGWSLGEVAAGTGLASMSDGLGVWGLGFGVVKTMRSLSGLCETKKSRLVMGFF